MNQVDGQKPIRRTMQETPSEIGFNIMKNIIKIQNKKLLKAIAIEYDMDYQTLVDSYIRPEYYLPIVQKTNSVQNKNNGQHPNA